MAALGRSGIKVSEKQLEVYLGDVCVMREGSPVQFHGQALSARLADNEVLVRLHLNVGRGQATAWGCDLSEEYVTINSAYTT